MGDRITFKGFLGLLLALLLFNIVTVSVGSDQSTATVSNKTAHYLHVFIDDQQFLYVSPERSVTYASDAKPTMLVTVFYAPGQGISGSATDTLEVPYRGAREGCTCEEDAQWGDCTFTPATGGSARWEVLPEDLVPEE